jgi:magnesium transporter
VTHALEVITERVSNTALQRLKNIKTDLSQLTTRVEAVRGVVQRYLDDDDGMKEVSFFT